ADGTEVEAFLTRDVSRHLGALGLGELGVLVKKVGLVHRSIRRNYSHRVNIGPFEVNMITYCPLAGCGSAGGSHAQVADPRSSQRDRSGGWSSFRNDGAGGQIGLQIDGSHMAEKSPHRRSRVFVVWSGELHVDRVR